MHLPSIVGSFMGIYMYNVDKVMLPSVCCKLFRKYVRPRLMVIKAKLQQQLAIGNHETAATE